MLPVLSSASRLVGSTGNDYNYIDNISSVHNIDLNDENVSDSSITSKIKSVDHDSGNFRNLSWSADGTTLMTTSADNTIRTFILPPDLLDPPSPDQPDIVTSSSHHIKSYSNHTHPTPIYATAISPYYKLSSPETTLILSSSSSLPIRLISPFATGILSTYPLINPSTERWIAPHSLLFSVSYSNPDSSCNSATSLRFLAGSQNQISLFDISRDGARPMTTFATAPGNRKARRGGSTGMAGIVSAMALSCDGTLAAGTFSRGVGLYDSQGMGDAIGTWSLMGDGEDGSGVTSLHWSMCGRYLVVAERGSDGLGVWDIRGTGRRLAWLVGRKARTMQRLGVALGSNLIEDGGNVYAGGTDGYVRLWKGIGVREGTIDSDWQWMAHDDVISGLGVHACGSVVATCSGSRRDVITDQHDLEEDSGGDSGFDDQSKEDKKAKDNSIRVWSLEPRASSQDDS